MVYTLGGSISYLWEISPNYRILPTVGLSWQHEFLNYGQSISARFANGSGVPFSFYSSSGARNNAFGTVGVTAQIGPRFGAYAYYNPQFGGGQIVSHGALVGLSYNF
jgi:outer membrane autotransporter protein